MATKIFLTGATGFIGGHVLHTLVSQHPEFEITVLLRTVPADFLEQYPNVKIVKGDFESADVLSDAASRADIVIHNGNSDHEGAVGALLKGLQHRSTSSYYIHLGGTGIIADVKTGPYGMLNPKVWSDIVDIDQLWSMPPDAGHRNTEILIQQAITNYGHKIKAAVVCPPDVYGRGSGPGRKSSFYMPLFWEGIQKLGATYYTGEGANKRGYVHIDDVMKVYLKLVESAAKGGQGTDWGLQGYYFTTTQEWSQLEIARAAGKIFKGKGLVKSEEPKCLALDDLTGLLDRVGSPIPSLYLFCSNARTVAERAPKVLGFEATAPTLMETLESEIEYAVQDGPKQL
ncbi:NAD(P)-binding protein [Neofusicoccum parvum]|uniref:NAD(P)-binding protein n=1 Tax=Neofusicoccum parvum TaxID=310453 RepID=A0ACB5SEL4_9PEZI|nr:NAD(P)-binding protein [Neofusicoccum parvum]